MKFCVIGNQSRTIFVFWQELMRQMIAAGHQVVCPVPPGDDVSETDLKNLGCSVRYYRLDRKGVNPARDVLTLMDFRRIFREEHPDCVFATTIKGVIYGCLAAKMAGIPHIYATITGLGYAFEADTFFKKCINRLSIFLYHTALNHIEGVFFQNQDDAALFRNCGILTPKARVLFARGTGVDTDRFAQAPLPGSGPVVFLVVARLLVAKGFREYAEAARIVHAERPGAAVFRILGPLEEGLGSVPEAEVKSWVAEGIIEYLGKASDVRPHVAAAHVVVLPSWREGTPTSVMEGMSIGRAAIVTNVTGCREVVREGENGFLVPAKNPALLAQAMEKFIDTPSLAEQMGTVGREMAVRDFDARTVASKILSDMHISCTRPCGGFE